MIGCGAVAVQVVDAPGARVVAGQVTAPAVGSLTATLVSVVVPVFLTRNDQAIRVAEVGLAVAVDVGDRGRLGQRAGSTAWATGVSVDDGFDVHVAPPGPCPVAVAVLVTTPASTSAWVIGVRRRPCRSSTRRAPAW